jgi:hypothetical protein
MNTFEITIQRQAGQEWPVVVEYSRSGEFLPRRTVGVLKLSAEQQTELLALGQDPLAYGTLLGQALFSGPVHTAFIQARAMTSVGRDEKEEERLRVLLLVEDQALRTWHWERLCAPTDVEGWDFLALDQRVPFSIYMPSAAERRFRPIGRRDLRALVLVANPQNLGEYGLDDFDDAATVACVQAALGDIPNDVLANVEDAAGPPTLDELARRITAESYTLLHIVAHGQYQKRKGETALYLADENNQVAAVTAT